MRFPFACRLLATASILTGAILLASCSSSGHFTLFGYTSRPNYDPTICTVCVPMFQNKTLRRGLEFELTRAVVREIERTTPYKVVSDPLTADTELQGTVLFVNKNILNRNQLNEVREAEMVLGTELVWRRRNGEVLSNPALRPAAGPPHAGIVSPEEIPPPPPPVLVTATGGFIPEVGESITTAEKRMIDRLAVQIVSMMEQPW